MPLTECPACGSRVSALAPLCPSCGHVLQKPTRSVFGKVVLWAFAIFNGVMAYWFLWVVSAGRSELDSAASTAEQAGTTIGLGIVFTIILLIWICGALVGGIAVFLTRPTPSLFQAQPQISPSVHAHAKPVITAAAPTRKAAPRPPASSLPAIRIPFNRMRVALLLASLVCIAVGGLLTLDSGVLKGSVRGGVLGLLIPLVLPFLLLLIVSYLRKGLDPTRLGVMVRDTGITDNTSVIPNLFLPWDNITDIEERVYGNRTCLVLSLDSAETVIQQLPRILHPLGRIVAQGVLTGGNAYVLAPFVLDVPYEALKAVILERFNAYRSANDLPEATADYVPVDLNSLKRKSKQPYALFSERAVAFALDISLFLVPISIACDTLCWLLGLMCGEGVRSRMEVLLPQVAWGSYFTCCHASSWQATIGKRVLGLIVVTDKGTRLSVPRAIARYGALLLSLLSLGIGILMPLWTERRQALHDILVKTLVTRKPTQRTTNTREKT